jgi:pilus assembly protein CpaF
LPTRSSSNPVTSQTLPISTQNRLPKRGNQEQTAVRQPLRNTQPEGVSDLTNYGALTEVMADPSIEEIWINSPNRIFVAKSGKSELTNIVMNSEEVRLLVERLLMWGGRRLDLSHPFVDARLPDGSRLHVTIPEITEKHWAINIRKHLMRGKSLDELREMGVMNLEISEFLNKAVNHGLNILVAGSTQAGKTTLLNALIGAMPLHNRVITVEEVFELRPQVSDCIAMQTRTANLQGEGAIPLRLLIKEALRMRPNNLVVGEIREAESLDLLIALNSGLPGMATIHANSARDAIAKLQTLPLLAGENISYEFIAPIVAASIDLIIFVATDSSGARRIIEIAKVTGRIEGNRVEIENLFSYQGLEENVSEGNIPRKNAVASSNYKRGLGDIDEIFNRAPGY